jgi:hypothetical protein
MQVPLQKQVVSTVFQRHGWDSALDSGAVLAVHLAAKSGISVSGPNGNQELISGSETGTLDRRAVKSLTRIPTLPLAKSGSFVSITNIARG